MKVYTPVSVIADGHARFGQTGVIVGFGTDGKKYEVQFDADNAVEVFTIKQIRPL